MSAQKLFLRFEGGKPKAFTMSFDDARLRDADIIRALQQCKMKATFFLADGMFGKSQYLVADKAGAKALYANTGMEVAGHTVNHRDLPTVLEQEGEDGLRREIVDNIKTLEQLFGCRVLGLSYSGAPPYKLYNDAVMDFAAKNGVCYARGVANNQNRFALPQNWLSWGPTAWVGNVDELHTLAKQFVTAAVNDEPMVYNIWGHAYDIDDKWESFEAFEQFLKDLAFKADVWYASYGDIYCYAKEFEKLELADNTVTNHSYITLWFAYGGKTYKIDSHQKINI